MSAARPGFFNFFYSWLTEMIKCGGGPSTLIKKHEVTVAAYDLVGNILMSLSN